MCVASGSSKVFIKTRRVQEQGIHLERLVYLTKEEFKFLRLLRKRFLEKTRRFFKKPTKAKSLPKKQPLRRTKSPDLDSGNGKICLVYEPTNILATLQSLPWRWRRVKEYYRGLEDGDNKEMIKEVYRLIYS